jgi:hypothetical protein
VPSEYTINVAPMSASVVTAGAQGPAGPAGANGANGTNGEDGADGAPGPNLVDATTATDLAGFLRGDGSAVYATAQVTLSDIDPSGAADGQVMAWSDGGGTWVPATVSASPGGSDTQLQLNDGGAFGGASGLTTDDGTNLTATGYVSANLLRSKPAGSGIRVGYETQYPSGTPAFRMLLDESGTGYAAYAGYTPAGEQFFRIGGGPQDNPLSVVLNWNGYPNISFSFGCSGDGNSRIQMSHGLSVEPHGAVSFVQAGAAGSGWTSYYYGRTDVTSRLMFDHVATWLDDDDGTRRAQVVEGVYDTDLRPCLTKAATGSGATLTLHAPTTCEAGFIPATLADASAPNGSVYHSSDGDCLAYKTSSGDIRYLSYTTP